MSQPFLLTEPQLLRISPYFPLSHGKSRVDDQRAISGIIYMIRNGLMWRDAPVSYGPQKTVYNRFIRWIRMGVFGRILIELTNQAEDTEEIMIDATHLKAHWTAASLVKRGVLPRFLGRTKGGLNSKLHVICDGQGRPLRMFLSAGQVSDYIGAAALLSSMPQAKVLLADKGYDADWFRDALADRGIEACIPSKSNRKIQIPHDKWR